MVDGMSTEAGKLLGAFLVTIVSEIITKVFGRGEDQVGDDMVESVKDLQPLIEKMNHFKKIHNFTQTFLDQNSRNLFVKDVIDGILLSDPDEISQTWKKCYTEYYEKDVIVYETNIKAFRSKAEHFHEEGNKVELPHGLTNATKEAVTTLGSLAPKAYEKSDEFIYLLKETASIAINKEIKFVDAPKWENGTIKQELDGFAKETLGYADAILIRLIQVLDELYKRMVPATNE